MKYILFIVVFAWKATAQDTIVFPKIDLFKRNIIELSYGIPLGELANKYESSINTAIYFRTKIAKKQFIDFGSELSGIVHGKEIAYQYKNEKIVLDGSKSAFSLGFRYSSFLFQSKNENFHIESNSGLAWRYLHYQKPKDEIYAAMDFEPSLNTIAVSQGIKIMYCGFGLHCNSLYAPYDLFHSRVGKNFGGLSINLGVSGSWNF